MAKNKSSRSRGQGLFSWLTSIFALLIGFAPLLGEAWSWLMGNATWGQTADNLQRYYNPLRKDRDALMIGYGSMIGGIALKIGSQELVKRAKVRSIVPRLT